METPEWDFFKRIENLEGLKPTLADTSKIALVTFWLTFINMAAEHPSEARKIKDNAIALFELLGLSTKVLNSLKNFMLITCKGAEE